MKTYKGVCNNGDWQVFVSDGKILRRLNPRNDLVNHSPDGFAWGYGGSGPAQLALALLADLIDDKSALEQYQDFKWRVIARLPMDRDFQLTEAEIAAHVTARPSRYDAEGA